MCKFLALVVFIFNLSGVANADGNGDLIGFDEFVSVDFRVLSAMVPNDGRDNL